MGTALLAGALATAALAFGFVLRQPRPVLAEAFSLPTKKEVDWRLVRGAALFGVGWGLVWLCPRPALASLAHGLPESVFFVGAMVTGMAAARVIP